MRFSRISVTKKEVALSWTTAQENGTSITHELTSRDKPLGSFVSALQGFSGFALELIGAPKDWDEGVKVTTVNLKEDTNGRRGLMVSFSRKIDRARGAAVSITTPILWEADNPDGDIGDGFYGHIVDGLIDDVEVEATKFQSGERVQGEIFPATEAQPAVPVSASRGRGKKKNRDFIPGGGDIVNADKTDPPTDENLRQQLLTADRDVPVDAIARWTSQERDAAQRWAGAVIESVLNKKPLKVEEPDVVKRDATLPLTAEEHHAGATASV